LDRAFWHGARLPASDAWLFWTFTSAAVTFAAETVQVFAPPLTMHADEVGAGLELATGPAPSTLISTTTRTDALNWTTIFTSEPSPALDLPSRRR